MNPIDLVFDTVEKVKNVVAAVLRFAASLILDLKDPGFRKYAVGAAGVVAFIAAWALGEHSPEFATIDLFLVALGVKQAKNQ